MVLGECSCIHVQAVARIHSGHALQGLDSRQYDAWQLGIVTSDDFTAADIQYTETLPAVRQALQMGLGQPPHIPVVTGFLGRGIKTGVLL